MKKILLLFVFIFINLNSRPDIDLKSVESLKNTKYNSKLELANIEKELEKAKDELKKNNIKKILFFNDIEISELIKNFENLIKEDKSADFNESAKDLIFNFNKDFLAFLASSEFTKKIQNFYDQNFNSDEIRQILRFFKSKAGVKLRSKLPKFLSQELYYIKNILYLLLDKHLKNSCKL